MRFFLRSILAPALLVWPVLLVPTTAQARVAGTPPTLSCPLGSTVFDWDARAWAAGSTANSYAVTGIGTIGFTVTNPGTFLNQAAYGGQSPTRQNVVTGGYAPAQYSIMELVDLPNRTAEVTTTIALGTAVPGAQFRIFDVDYSAGQFADKVTVTGYYNGTAVLPTLTNGVTNYVTSNTAIGDATSADNSANGNVVVTFSAPIDTIVIAYGNDTTAPTNPGQQAVTLHDITFCSPQGGMALSKISSVVSDPVNGATNPKAIPGAVIEYCLLMTGTGSANLTGVTASDPIPSTVTYVPGSMRSGTSCSTATTVEDDDPTGADESDPFGAAIMGSTVSATAASLPAGSSFALTFRATVT